MGSCLKMMMKSSEHQKDIKKLKNREIRVFYKEILSQLTKHTSRFWEDRALLINYCFVHISIVWRNLTKRVILKLTCVLILAIDHLLAHLKDAIKVSLPKDIYKLMFLSIQVKNHINAKYVVNSMLDQVDSRFMRELILVKGHLNVIYVEKNSPKLET